MMNCLRSIHTFRLLIILLLLGADTRAVIAGNQKAAVANPRQQISLSGDGWQFEGVSSTETLPEINSRGYTDGPWQNISIPYVFQTRLHYDTPAQGWFRRDLVVRNESRNRRLYLVFEGVTSVAELYVNGKRLGEHRGAFTRFLFDITEEVHPGSDNHLAIRVDNRPQQIADLLPNKTRLYKLWGGINRNVWLLSTSSVGIDPTDFASPGVYITSSEVSEKSAKLSVKVLLRNNLSLPQKVNTKAVLLDPANNEVATYSTATTLSAGKRIEIALGGNVAHPRLWAPLAPQLYHVRVEVAAAGVIIDSVTQPTGFRTVEFRWKERQIYVNGQRIRLYGSDQHAELEEKENALSDQDLIRSFDAMSDLGVNFMRLPHYPHAQLEYDLCDARGILCWPEDGHTNDEIFGPTAQQIITEMVKQNYNHPSIALWSVGNEASQETAESSVPVVRMLDPNRPVVVANMKCGTCDFRTANSYPGWYSKQGLRSYKPTGFITEIGIGGVVTIHTDYDKADYRFDSYEPEEYQQIGAEALMASAFDPQNDKLAMFLWWTMRDMSDGKYKKPVGINTKGLLTYAGDRKDIYYLYRSFLRPGEPTVHLTSQRYFLRRGSVNNGIKAYSNAKSLTLTLNGERMSTLANGEYTQPDGPYLAHWQPDPAAVAPKVPNVFYWRVPLHEGKNLIAVSDGESHTDTSAVYFYGADGLPTLPDSKPLLSALTSSNPANPAYLMDMPVQAQWPLYYDLDGSADDSWNRLPAIIEGSRWIALHKVTKKGMATVVGFTPTRATTVYVVETVEDMQRATSGSDTPSTLRQQKFTALKDAPILWRNNELLLVPAMIYSRSVAAEEHVEVSLGERDAIILLRPSGK
jgi:beta-galactosidase